MTTARKRSQWLLAGLTTWHGLPGALKRRQFGAYLRAQWARIVVLKDVGAMAFAALLLALSVGSVLTVYPWVATLWQPEPPSQALAQLKKSLALCGTQQTGDFEGMYEAVPEPPDYGAASPQLAKADPVAVRTLVTLRRLD